MRFLLILTPLFFLVFSATSLATTFELQHLSSLKHENLKGDFTQTKILKEFNQTINFSGNFKLENNTLFWEIQTPIHNLLKITQDGIFEKQNNAWIKLNSSYDKELFLDIVYLNFEALERYFAITPKGNIEQWSITLTPKNIFMQKIFTSITLKGGKNNQKPFITEMIFIEKQGDITTTRFKVL